MSQERTAVETVKRTASTAGIALGRVLFALAALGLLVGWSALWVTVAEAQWARGDLLAAVLVTLVFVVTAIGAAVTFVLRWADIDLPTPDVSPTSS